MSHKTSALAVLAGVLALDLSGLAVLNAALPGIGAEFALDDATLQWTMTAYAATFAGFLLFGGRAADVAGRKRVLVIGVAVFTVAAVAGAFAVTAAVLMAARAVQGLGAALSGPAAIALLAEVFPAGPARDRALGVYAAVGAISFSGGMVLGGVLTDTFGWRAVLLFSAVFGVLILGLAVAGLPAAQRGRRQPLDLVGAGLVTAGLVLAIVGVSRDEGALVSLTLSAALLACFVIWERRVPQPLLPLRLLRIRPVRMAALGAFLQYAAAVGMLFFAALYLQNILGYSPARSGLAVVPMSLAVSATATFLAGRLLARFGARRVLGLGVALIGAAMGLWMWTPVGGDYWWHILPGLLVSGVGQGLAFPAMTSAGLAGVAPEHHAVAGAVNATAQQIGASVGVAALVVVADAFTVGGGVNDRLHGYHIAYAVAAAACLVGALSIVGGRGTQ